MDEPRDCHTKWSKSDRGEILYDIPYMWNLKKVQMNLLTKLKETHRFRKQTWLPGGRDSEGIWEGHVYIAVFKWITNCIAHGTLLNVLCHPGWGEVLGENGYKCMYDWVPLLFTRNDHDTVNQLYPNTK